MLSNFPHATTQNASFTSLSSSQHILTLQSLVTIGIVIVEMFLVCHMISNNNVIKESCDYIDRSP